MLRRILRDDLHDEDDDEDDVAVVVVVMVAASLMDDFQKSVVENIVPPLSTTMGCWR